MVCRACGRQKNRENQTDSGPEGSVTRPVGPSSSALRRNETSPDVGNAVANNPVGKCIFSDNPPPADWKVGAEIDVRVRSCDYDKGTGVFFDVKKV